MRKAILTLLLLYIVGGTKLLAQYSYGTTGLLNMPTADMQRDKTFMFGGNYLEKHTSTGRWFYDTYNYYVNITIFPWIEFSYNMTLHKALPNDPIAIGFWVPRTYGKFANQDRQFNARIRLWKEGWWRGWTPQVVIGSDDISSHSWGDTSKRFSMEDFSGNSFNNRYYLAVTKHFTFEGVGTLGAHLSYIYNRRSDYPLNAPALGANFQFALPTPIDKTVSWQRALNGLNLMAEFYPANNEGVHYVVASGGEEPGRGLHIGKWDVNFGGSYTVWKDYINFYGELFGCRYFSGGIQFRLHLR